MAVIGYNFYRDGVKVNENLWPDTTFTYAGLASNADYSLTATAVDAAGNESELSTVLVASTTESPDSGVEMSDADKAAIDAIVTEAQGSIPGVILSVSGPKGQYKKAYGTTPPTGGFLGIGASSRPLTTDDHFRMGSITKMFTGMAALQQVDAGLLSLDDTLEQYIPGVPNGTIITIEQLLSMRSGVYNYTGDLLVLLMIVLAPTSGFSTQQAIDMIRSHPSAFNPGTSYAYNNSNAILVGEIVATVTGRPIETVIQEDIFDPLGMTESEWPTGNGVQEPAASISQFNPAFAGAAGALTTTITDLTRFARAVRDGELLSTDMWDLWVNKFYGPYPTNLETVPRNIGYGYFIQCLGNWIGHDGSVAGTAAGLLIDPGSGTVVTVSVNTADGTTAYHKICRNILAYLYPDSVAERNFDALRARPDPSLVEVIGQPPNLVVTSASKILAPTAGLVTVMGHAPSTATPEAGSVAVTGGNPDVLVFVPFNEENQNRIDRPVPAGCNGCYVTLGGGGASGGGAGVVNTAGGLQVGEGNGGGGGGGGGRLRVFIPAANLGSTYSISRGLGGASKPEGVVGAAGGASTFTSGTIELSALGGSGGGTADTPTGGLGGGVSVVGAVTVDYTETGGNGGGGAVPTGPGLPPGSPGADSVLAGAGGGGGGCHPGGTSPGGKGGDSATVPGGSSSTSAANAALGLGGAGGGGGAGRYEAHLPGDSGGAGGSTGGGGGGGGGKSNIRQGGNSGPGGPGYTLIEWV